MVKLYYRFIYAFPDFYLMIDVAPLFRTGLKGYFLIGFIRGLGTFKPYGANAMRGCDVNLIII